MTLLQEAINTLVNHGDRHLYQVIFHHRHGINAALLIAAEHPSDEDACKAFGWEFEPEREDEYVETWRMNPEDIAVL